MLRGLKMHLLFALTALLMLVACGKKVEDGSVVEQRRDGLDLPSRVVLEVISTSSNSPREARYVIPRDGDVWLPLVIGTTVASEGQKVRLDVNLIDGESEFRCYWQGHGLEYRFQSCIHPDGRDLGLTPGNLRSFSFPIDQGKELLLRLTAVPTTSAATASAALDLRWK